MFSRIPVSTNPVGRSWHTLTAVSDNALFLFGGLSVDCKPMSKKMYLLLRFYFSRSFGHFMFFIWFLFNFLNQVTGGCSMLKQRNGEKSSILLRISQGSELCHQKFGVLHSKVCVKLRTDFIYLFVLHFLFYLVSHNSSSSHRYLSLDIFTKWSILSSHRSQKWNIGVFFIWDK